MFWPRRRGKFRLRITIEAEDGGATVRPRLATVSAVSTCKPAWVYAISVGVARMVVSNIRLILIKGIYRRDSGHRHASSLTPSDIDGYPLCWTRCFVAVVWTGHSTWVAPGVVVWLRASRLVRSVIFAFWGHFYIFWDICNCFAFSCNRDHANEAAYPFATY